MGEQTKKKDRALNFSDFIVKGIKICHNLPISLPNITSVISLSEYKACISRADQFSFSKNANNVTFICSLLM